MQDLQSLFWTESEVNGRLEHLLESAFQQVLKRAKRDGIPHRLAAIAIGLEKVRAGKRLRGLFP